MPDAPSTTEATLPPLDYARPCPRQKPVPIGMAALLAIAWTALTPLLALISAFGVSVTPKTLYGLVPPALSLATIVGTLRHLARLPRGRERTTLLVGTVVGLALGGAIAVGCLRVLARGT